MIWEGKLVSSCQERAQPPFWTLRNIPWSVTQAKGLTVYTGQEDVTATSCRHIQGQAPWPEPLFRSQSIRVSRDLPPFVPYTFPSTYGKTDLQHSSQPVGHQECWSFHTGDTLPKMGVTPTSLWVGAHPWACHAQPNR